MNKFQLRSRIEKEKKTKKTYLSEGVNTRQILSNASTSEITTLINILFFLVSGEIPIKAHMFEKIKKSKKLNMLNEYFSNKKMVQTVLNWKHMDKLRLLFKFLQIYKALLYPLFNQQQ